MVDQAKDRQEQRTMLVISLDRLTANYIRYVLTSEFEARVQDLVLKGNPSTGRQLSKMYLNLMRQYYGHDQTVVSVDDVQAAQWINSPVSFFSFEGLNFPLSNSVGSLLVEKVRAGDAKVKQGFYARYPGHVDDITSYDLLKAVGVDMASQEPYRAYFRRLNFLLEQLERVVAE